MFQEQDHIDKVARQENSVEPQNNNESFRMINSSNLRRKRNDRSNSSNKMITKDFSNTNAETKFTGTNKDG
jgi:hypothetical protein